MDEERRELFKSLGFLSSVGISMVVSTFIGLGMGRFPQHLHSDRQRTAAAEKRAGQTGPQ